MNTLWNHSQIDRIINQIFRHTPDMSFIIYDTKYQIQYAEGSKRTFEDIYLTGSRGKYIAEVIGTKSFNFIKPSLYMGVKGKEVSVEFKRNHEEFFLWVSPLPNEKDLPDGGIAIIQNITSDKNTERDLRRSRKKEMEANEAKSLFLANITHELKTPLNAILGFSEHLLETDLTVEQKKFTEIINKSSEHLYTLVNEILTLSRLDKDSDLKKENFNLKEQVTFVIDILSSRAKSKNLDFIYEINEDVPDQLLGDPLWIREILMNIAGNAIKFTHKGYVKILVEVRDQDEKQADIYFTVADSGIGIEKSFQEKIFEQFAQVDSNITRKYGGTGLGLSITKKLVDIMKGEIRVDSNPSDGTRFYIHIPFEKGKEIKQEKGSANPDIQRVLKDKKILVVDDDQVNRMLAEITLTKNKARVDTASDAISALERVGNNKYDLILIDLHMPEISGYTLAEKLRNDGIDVPLVAITAALPDKKDWVNRFDSLILKPYRKKELLMAVMSYLRGDSEPVSGTVQSNSKEGYSLESIKEFAHDDKEMLQRLIRTFIKNAESGLRKMEGESDIRIIAETAHKLLPSFRHLQAQSLVDKLETLKESGKESTPLDPKEIVGEIVLESRELIEKLKKEL